MTDYRFILKMENKKMQCFYPFLARLYLEFKAPKLWSENQAEHFAKFTQQE